jgi:hypothetical protein
MERESAKALTGQRILCLLAIGVVGAWMMSGCSDSSSPSLSSVPTSEDASTTLTGEAVKLLEKQYGVFRGPRLKSDAMAPSVVSPLSAKRLGVDLKHSRYARSYKRARIYVVPARRTTCLFSEITAISFCWNTWTVANEYGTSTVLCGQGLDKSKVVTFGIVATEVGQVTIVEGDGSRLTVPVRNNVFVGETSSNPPPPLLIEWDVKGQRARHPIRDSFKVAHGNC